MIKFFGITLDVVVLLIVLLSTLNGNSDFLLFPCVLFWFNAISTFLMVFLCGAYYQSVYEHETVTWRIYDFITNILFVLICLYLGYLWLGGFLLIMSISKAAKIEIMENELKEIING